MVKTRKVTIEEKYLVCDLCGTEIAPKSSGMTEPYLRIPKGSKEYVIHRPQFYNNPDCVEDLIKSALK